MLRVLIVDDEAPARRYLRRLLEAEADVHVAGEAATPEQARTLIREHRPDAMFLDIELTTGTGFDLLDGLETPPAVVFVTAHSDYAARAFDIAAVDYLLKPVGPDRLAQALARLRPRAAGHLALRTRSGTKLIKVHELSLAQAQGDYVLLCSAVHANELMHITFKRLAAQLPCPPFCALSRSVIINLEHISHVSQLPGAQTEVAFNNGVAPVVLGRVASQRLRRAVAQR
ncbi:LytR/AlgR family response regulator transcription factor [Achromobacter anxifer]|jgi:two-component system LytT family response regulator|uniref:Transcriptional regulatory protein BtsR n=1 Tax=Achromobacter anxifer TaxID=1287737 RepID=A0A6S7CZW2_9BURK|nr:LytTR family DNA-binding domain-containing protein [Achromobacter anxifer]MDF8363831.1 LytTR family DNA-binding domain-containing protein [Achromobacter anxifer]CAB3872230.1 Transcriptional regulatory protein BtsR [Achromobacter anxifer]CAB5511259.1 Transcriptional regulatory protein BtsR [Achromobacter anxifer]